MEEENRIKKELFDDEWLTRALHARSKTEARTGLEERILARLASEMKHQPQSASRWRWMPGLAVALGLMLVILVGRAFLHVRPHTQNERVKTTQPEAMQPRDFASAAQRIQASKAQSDAAKNLLRRANTRNSTSPVVAKADRLPRLDKFPAEAPATEQEKLMAELQRRQFTASLAQYARDFREVKDLVIENNSIPPLSPETADQRPNL
jgi:hypothetical protein